ncbi:exonuclease domain-containing protein [Gracilibacillus marinus]|uniref:Exonuclease domain-containing protein n=1 Tax=Gracilibacillus marinus TaxID=630535 RepID=A0ABV8VX66_9BACI
MNYVAIDFETANQDRFSPCAVGLVVFNKEGVVNEYYSLINPNMEFDSYNSMIHGITEEDVLGAPTFTDIWDELSEYLTHHICIAHNASFDMSVLRHTLDHFNITHPEIDYLCTRIISKLVWPGLFNYKLNTIADFKKISFNHHNALEDAKAAAELFRLAIIESEVEDGYELIDKYKLIQGKIFEGGYIGARTPRLNRKSSKGKSLKVSDLKPETKEFDESHLFFSKTVIFTGTLQSMTRKEAMQKVINVGGKCSNSLLKTTNYLVIGDLDFTRLKDGKKSSKMIKAEEMINGGQDLEIISEEEFISFL